MGLDPKKLAALVDRETDSPMKSLGHGDDDEEGGGEEHHDDEGGDDEEGGGEDDDANFIELSPREIEDIIEMVEDGEGDPELMKLGKELGEALEEAEDGEDDGADDEEDDGDEDGEGDDGEGGEAKPSKTEHLNPPAWAGNKGIWSKAKDAVDPDGKGAKYDVPYAVVAHVYKRMGGKIKKARYD